MTTARESDVIEVARQLGRDPTTDFTVVARCPGEHPLVIKNHPLDGNGKPFPTLYWLTCPAAVTAVSRIESVGAIKELAGRARNEPEFGRALDAAHRAYASERGGLLAESEEWGGVGGTRQGVKCLHAHYAYQLAGGEDPVGAWAAGRVEPIHPEAGTNERVAAIDVGTNSVRLLVADAVGDDVSEIARDAIITRLGRGVDESGRFADEAVERTLGALRTYVRRARALRGGRVRVGATSAVRDVAGNDQFLEAVEALAGAPPEVLTGEREAELAFLGATRGLDRTPPFLVFDIGGGSTELALGRRTVEASVSVDIGSVRLTERVRPEDPPTERDLESITELAVAALAEAEKSIPPGSATTLVGVAGTTTTVQALALGLERYDPEAIHRSVVSRADVERVADDLAKMTIAERAAIPVMARGREDVIVAGARILLAILERWGASECIVSERDLLDGLAIEMVGKADPR
ncbi:MAG: DUF501 domain-containing protein [Actinomycetota bacterium]